VTHNPCLRARAIACAALGWWLVQAVPRYGRADEAGAGAPLESLPAAAAGDSSIAGSAGPGSAAPDVPGADPAVRPETPAPANGPDGVAGAAAPPSEETHEPPVAVPSPPAWAPRRSADGTVSVMVAPPPAPPATIAPPVAASAAAELAGTLLSDAGPADVDLAGGRPLTLIEALERPGDRARRLWIAQAYWKASAALATVRSQADAVARIEGVAPGGAARDRDAVDTALAGARADLEDARAELAAARQELADLALLSPGEPLPWPADVPLVVPYQTHFAVIFASRPSTGRVRAVDRMLPHRHAALEARAAAALACRRATIAADEDHARGACPVEAVLSSHETLARVERQWSADVRVYNTLVAEYVMAVADATVPDEAFARMLIGSPLPRPLAPGFAAAPSAAGQAQFVGGAGAWPAGQVTVPTAPPLLVSPPGVVVAPGVVAPSGRRD